MFRRPSDNDLGTDWTKTYVVDLKRALFKDLCSNQRDAEFFKSANEMFLKSFLAASKEIKNEFLNNIGSLPEQEQIIGKGMLTKQEFATNENALLWCFRPKISSLSPAINYFSCPQPKLPSLITGLFMFGCHTKNDIENLQTLIGKDGVGTNLLFDEHYDIIMPQFNEGNTTTSGFFSTTHLDHDEEGNFLLRCFLGPSHKLFSVVTKDWMRRGGMQNPSLVKWRAESALVKSMIRIFTLFGINFGVSSKHRDNNEVFFKWMTKDFKTWDPCQRRWGNRSRVKVASNSSICWWYMICLVKAGKIKASNLDDLQKLFTSTGMIKERKKRLKDNNLSYDEKSFGIRYELKLRNLVPIIGGRDYKDTFRWVTVKNLRLEELMSLILFGGRQCFYDPEIEDQTTGKFHSKTDCFDYSKLSKKMIFSNIRKSHPCV